MVRAKAAGSLRGYRSSEQAVFVGGGDCLGAGGDAELAEGLPAVGLPVLSEVQLVGYLALGHRRGQELQDVAFPVAERPGPAVRGRPGGVHIPHTQCSAAAHPAVQLGDELGFDPLRLAEQQLTEQVVVAEPLAVGVSSGVSNRLVRSSSASSTADPL